VFVRSDLCNPVAFMVSTAFVLLFTLLSLLSLGTEEDASLSCKETYWRFCEWSAWANTGTHRLLTVLELHQSSLPQRGAGAEARQDRIGLRVAARDRLPAVADFPSWTARCCSLRRLAIGVARKFEQLRLDLRCIGVFRSKLHGAVDGLQRLRELARLPQHVRPHLPCPC